MTSKKSLKVLANNMVTILIYFSLTAIKMQVII